MTSRFTAVGWVLAIAVMAAPQAAGDQCPPRPSPIGCPQGGFYRSTFTELDGNMDGLPDNTGRAGDFCTGNSPADCTAQFGVEVGYDLIVSDPLVQDVTCTTQGAHIWIMDAGCSECLATGDNGSVTLPKETTDQSHLQVVVSDQNGDICPCVGSVTCTFSVEVECCDGADGDGDGLIDDRDPDCCLVDNDCDWFCAAEDCDDSNLIVHEAPAAAELHVAQSLSDTQLSWDVSFGEWVDVVSGSLSDLRGSGDFTFATCLIEDDQNSTAADTRAAPGPGDGYYYLARSQNTCGGGSYGLDGTVPRDDLNSLAPCGYDPGCPGCTSCDLQDPPPVCGTEQCQASFGFPPTVCSGPTGSGGQGAVCDSSNDCLPGFACVDIGSGFACHQWCRVAFPDCPILCLPLPPPLIIDGTEYGVCS